MNSSPNVFPNVITAFTCATASRHRISMRIVRLANFIAPRSGGLRTVLRCLGEGYLRAGHEPVLVVPGVAAGDKETQQGRVITVPGPVLPGTGGYRCIIGRAPLRRLLDELAPDRLEVSDRFTLRWTGSWARERGVPALMISHESLTGLLRVAGLPGGVARQLADRLNQRTATAYDRVVCTTGWAAREFRRLGVDNLVEAPLGVDLYTFHPQRRDPELRAEFARPDQPLIVHCGRLSVEKRPQRSIAALAALRAAGVDAVLVVAGDGPMSRAPSSPRRLPFARRSPRWSSASTTPCATVLTSRRSVAP